MGGHMGHVRRTICNQPLVAVDAEHNVLLIGGSIPGPTGGYVVVRKSKTRA
jgi:large subunit ribosomal protein L3